MKVFHTAKFIAEDQFPPNIVIDCSQSIPDKEVMDLMWKYQTSTLPTLGTHHNDPEDFVKYYPDGTVLLGYHHGGEEVLLAVQAYVQERNLIPTRLFVESGVLTCGDDEHPCDNMPEPWFTRSNFYEKFDPDSWPPNWDQI